MMWVGTAFCSLVLCPVLSSHIPLVLPPITSPLLASEELGRGKPGGSSLCSELGAALLKVGTGVAKEGQSCF